MKRSEVNEILAEGAAFIASHGFKLPPFAFWGPERMRQEDAVDLRSRGLGWDITDYGAGRFDELGLFLFTLRNGKMADLAQGRGMLYAEKIMISRERQISPMHRHNLKAEDIINRGGGDLVLKLYASNPDGYIDKQSLVQVPSDGLMHTLPAGGHLRLKPGESVTLMPGVWHAFWAEKGDCLIGEVSTVNDDKSDNIFEAPIGRFPAIENDVEPTHLLVCDY